jgi:hypothetical protein
MPLTSLQPRPADFSACSCVAALVGLLPVDPVPYPVAALDRLPNPIHATDNNKPLQASRIVNPRMRARDHDR